jgi:hypothetical protein
MSTKTASSNRPQVFMRAAMSSLATVHGTAYAFEVVSDANGANVMIL